MRGRAFTLIELLVVVAIIALLVAILVPTLTEANRIAKMVVCSTHLKQIGLGINLYTIADPMEFLPIMDGLVGNTVQTDPSMPGYYYNYCMYGGAVGTYKSWMDLVFPYVDRTLGLFACTGFPDPFNRNPLPPPEERDSTHYGYNLHISGRGNFSVTPPRLAGSLRMGEIRRPSEIALVLDYRSIFSYCNWWDYPSYAAGLGYGEPWDFFRAHGGIQTNMGFVDQHVEAIDRFDPEYQDYYHWDPMQGP